MCTKINDNPYFKNWIDFWVRESIECHVISSFAHSILLHFRVIKWKREMDFHYYRQIWWEWRNLFSKQRQQRRQQQIDSILMDLLLKGFDLSAPRVFWTFCPFFFHLRQWNPICFILFDNREMLFLPVGQYRNDFSH